MDKKELDNSRKITKVSLVIYSSIMLVLAIVFLSLSLTKKNMSILWGYLLCLGPSAIFVLATIFLTFNLPLSTSAKKSTIALHIILHFFKYALIICIPLIGIWKGEIFYRWSMLVTTLIAPLQVILTKILFANIVSKNNKK